MRQAERTISKRHLASIAAPILDELPEQAIRLGLKGDLLLGKQKALLIDLERSGDLRHTPLGSSDQGYENAQENDKRQKDEGQTEQARTLLLFGLSCAL
jgi:hypothetical protein